MSTVYNVEDNVLYNTEIVSPKIPYATFSNGLAKGVAEEIVAKLNYGQKMLETYIEFKQEPLSLESLTRLTIAMDRIKTDYEYEIYSIRRKSR